MTERIVKFGLTESGRRFRSTERNVRGEEFTISKNTNGSILQHKAACACGGGCPGCQAKSENLPISQPHDTLEIDADRVADKVIQMRVSENPLFLNSNEAHGSSNIGSVFKLSGELLDAESRNFFEPRFGCDFSQVRIHRDSYSSAFAAEINAKAYTVGKDIGFAKGEYEPTSAKGRQLLAHELTHVIQQNRTTVDSTPLIARKPEPAKPPKDKPVPKPVEIKECETFPGGETDCEFTADGLGLTGKPVTTIYETNPCTKPCVAEHEAIHFKEFKKYFPKKKACDIEKDKGKSPSSECSALTMDMKKGECEAYKISLACVEKRLNSAKECQSPKNKEYGTRKLASEKCFHDYNCGSASKSESTKKSPEKKGVSDKK